MVVEIVDGEYLKRVEAEAIVEESRHILREIRKYKKAVEEAYGEFFRTPTGSVAGFKDVKVVMQPDVGRYEVEMVERYRDATGHSVASLQEKKKELLRDAVHALLTSQLKRNGYFDADTFKLVHEALGR